MSNKINKAYKNSKNIYDDVLTRNSLLGKFYINVCWGKTDDIEIADKILSYIPDDFTGTLLDVPVGTAVFTHEKWGKLSNAEITCLDYSEDMLYHARNRLDKYSNISLVQGDVGNLDLEDNYCDIVLSMNGFHAFPDKMKAYKEIHRVTKKEGIFIACFYIKGEKKITDFVVNNFLAKKGWFTPPFQTFNEVKTVLEELYSQVFVENDNSMIYFKCIK